jgi:flagellar biosynthesis/type III secretory pathway M-ring protein FliF/YscJ
MMGRDLEKEKAEKEAKAKAETEAKLAAEAAAKAEEEERKAAAEEDGADIDDDGSVVELSGDGMDAQEGHKPQSIYEQNLALARELAMKDPKIVAQVIKKWVNNE